MTASHSPCKRLFVRTRRGDRKKRTLDELLFRINVDLGTVHDKTSANVERLREHRPDESENETRLRNESLDRETADLPQRVHYGKTSRGRMWRVKYMDRNMLLHHDAGVVRKVLGIPDGEISIEVPSLREGEYLRGLEAVSAEKLKKIDPVEQGRKALGDIIGGFLLHHSSAVLGDVEKPAYLPADLAQLAINIIETNFSAEAVPVWLKITPSAGPEDLSASEEGGASGIPTEVRWPNALAPNPITWAIRCLLARHRLPLQLGNLVAIFVLTNDPRFLRGQQPLEWDSFFNSGAIESENARDLYLYGIDEYTTLDEWKWMWNNLIRPYQRRVRDLRGEGRRRIKMISSERIERSLPFWAERNIEGWEFAEAYETSKLALRGSETKTARDDDHDLDEIFKPADTGPHEYPP